MGQHSRSITDVHRHSLRREEAGNYPTVYPFQLLSHPSMSIRSPQRKKTFVSPRLRMATTVDSQNSASEANDYNVLMKQANHH
jgi:hypothetical protein